MSSLHGFIELKSRLKSYLDRIKKSEYLKFARSAFTIKTRPTFAALSLVLMLLPGSNYYLELELQPEEPLVQNLSIDLPPPSSYPIRDEEVQSPSLTARAAVIVDVNSASILFAKNPDEPLMPASTTKIMTALVALEHYDLDKILTIKQADRAIGQTMNLVPGERIKVKNLLYGLLLASGNDAAFALAENFPGGYNAFVNEMNRLAQKLYMTNTQFQNVSGVEQPGHYTSVVDLARLAAVAMKNPIFAEIVSTKRATVSDEEKTIIHPLQNKNELLGVIEGIRGVKTGWTENAGECLVTDTVREGNEIIVVVLGSKDRFGESASLIEWAYQAHTWVKPEVSNY